MATYAERCAELGRTLREGAAPSAGLNKEVSNLFRHRQGQPEHRLDVRSFNQVQRVEPDSGWMDVEGMTRYETAVDAGLRAGVMPLVVPELKTITVGGAAAGVGIEATSFRHGLVHETVLEMEGWGMFRRRGA